MFVDKSHSKKDILLLFGKLEVIIDDELTKGKIVSNIDKDFEKAIDDYKKERDYA